LWKIVSIYAHLGQDFVFDLDTTKLCDLT
jgi:hypothetical protein